MSRPVIDRLAARGAVPLHVPILQPAEPFLELAGEELRRRVFLSDDERGRTRCLRPELTIPAARAHIASGASGPVRYAVAGTVFRQRGPGEADEFPQAGIEAIGGGAAAGDARALDDAIALVDDLAPGAREGVAVGDRALHAAVLAAIGLPPALRDRLARLHGDPAAIRAALAPGSAGATSTEDALGADPALPAPVRAALEAGDRNALVRAIEGAIGVARMGKGARTASEIATRLTERHVPSGDAPHGSGRAALDAWLALECPLDGVSRAVAAILEAAPGEGASGGMSDVLNGALALHDARLAALREAGLDASALTFRAALGRQLDYYTGLVFEVTDADGAVLAAGGRYDRLLGLLGAAPEPAVGFALWLDRLGVGLDGTPTGGSAQ